MLTRSANSSSFSAKSNATSFTGNGWPRQAHSPASSEGKNKAEQPQMNTDQLIHLMEVVVAAVKSGDFHTQLAQNILALCQHLKVTGQHLEHTYKSELNRVFVSLRQAACRDSGQLGTPCRLKIMETVELRAMGWRSSLAHSQYYFQKASSAVQKGTIEIEKSPSDGNGFVPNKTGFSPPVPVEPKLITAPNYPNIPIPPVPPPPPAPLLIHASNPPTMGNVCTTTPTGYFVIPAGVASWPPPPQLVGTPPFGNGGSFNAQQHQQIPPTFLPPFLRNPMAQYNWLQNRQTMPDWAMSQQKSPQSYYSSTPMSLFRGGMERSMSTGGSSGTNSKSIKSPQFREELVIKNADSGKIMGVKGRRVAAVEELSKTIISFQKVEPKCRDRVLTITGSTEQSIQMAKRLVEDTIRRNVSPQRQTIGSEKFTTNGHSDEAEKRASGDEDEDDGDANEISIETGADGTIKLCCADPQILQAAQTALSEYLNKARRNSKMSTEDRERRKERRKSLPLQSLPDMGPIKFEQPPQNLKTKKNSLGSTPNLAADDNGINQSTWRLDKKPSETLKPQRPMQYDRPTMMTLREEGRVLCEKQLQVLKLVEETMPEIFLRDANER